jgi:ferredoxin
MAEYEIEIDKETCISAGTCIEICPENFQFDNNSKAEAKKKVISDDELKKNLEAARSCPVKAIHITNKETGEKLI